MNLRMTSLFFILLIMMVVNEARAWDIDWSRRQKKQDATATDSSSINTQNANVDSSAGTTSGAVVNGAPSVGNGTNVSAMINSGPAADPAKRKYLDGLVQSSRQTYTGDRQEFVILNTAKGFVPSNVRLHKGLHYVVHIVNVNEDKKNVSFMLDAFDQHYATYFGQIRSFNLDPDKEGIFDFQCPETNSTGKLIVFGTTGMSPARTISSEK